MTSSRLIIYCISLISICNIGKHADWIKFENATCKAYFPAVPKDDSSSSPTAIGRVTVFMHMVELEENAIDSNLVYGLIETEYPKEYLQDKLGPEFLKGFFNGAINGAVKNVNGSLISQKDIALKGIPGKEIKIDYGNGVAVITMRIYLKGLRMFALQTISLAGKESNLNSVKYFDSFEIK